MNLFKLKTPLPGQGCGTSKDWSTWETEAKVAEPIKYWLLETLPDWFMWNIGYAVTRTYRDAKFAVKCRTAKRYHVVNCGLKPGYYDDDTRMLHACFSILVDYVEHELPLMNGWFKETLRRRFTHWPRRSREEGIKHLEWEKALNDSPRQSNAAVEKMELYLWWKDVRPLRPNPDDEYCLLYESGVDDGLLRAAALRSGEIEAAQYEEDDRMLQRLVAIRSSLWT